MKQPVRTAMAALAAGTLLTSCGFGGDSGDGGGDGGDGGSTDLELLVPVYSDETQGLWEGIIEDFEAEHDDINVTVRAESWDNINDVVRTQVQSGQAPDILNIDAFAGFASDDLLYPASEVLSEETIADFEESFVENASIDGEQYGLPMIASARTLFYNQDLFDQAGIDAPPTTWAELEEAAVAITNLGGGVYGYGLPLGSEEAQAETAIWFFGGGGGYGDETTLTIDSPENIAAATAMQQLIEAGGTQPDPGATDRTPLINVFVQGQIGMIVGLPPTVGQLESDAPDLNYGTAPIPTEDGSPVTLGVADHLMAFDNGEDKAEAIKAFLDFFYSPEQYTAFVETENFIPVTKSGGEALADNEALAPFIEILPDAQFYPSTNPNWSAAQGAIQELIGQIGQGQDPATVLADIQARADG